MTKKGDVSLASMNKGALFVLSAPSGCGKDTVLSLLKEKNCNVKQSISVTTREIRDGEVDGVDYYFTDVADFEAKIQEGYFLEYVKYGENYYGTPRKKIEELVESGYNVFLKIEVEGAGNVRKFFPECVSIFIVPPSFNTLEARLKGRGTETDESINRRLGIARNELLRASEYDYIVVNDILDDCVNDVCAIINAEHSKYSQMKDFVDNL